ncbi:unnamed protein product [Gongylonema pulchrum]|uniref:Low-density lipoprotein receptor domain class A n=1 Tax=Gongylonema pulchrum TaxID=637853 RepID=A0A183EVC9_9BILA|nr:unnamed protein product [Gongylonema pulchrum]
MFSSCASAQMLTCGSPWQWMCNNGECIAQYDLCNGIAQCTDGSDEFRCNERCDIYASSKIQKNLKQLGLLSKCVVEILKIQTMNITG